MISNLPRMAFVALLAWIMAATAAMAIKPRTQEPARKPTAPRERDSEEKAHAAWRKVYHLERDQVVRRVAPPFIPERMVDVESRFPFLKQNRDRRGFVMTLIYHEKGGTLQNPSMSFSGAPDAKGRQLIHLIEGVGGIFAQDVEGPKELLETEISGDFLVREESKKADVIAALERILWLECELKIKLSLREVERDVIVARGKFTFKPRIEGRNDIDLYGSELGPEGGGGGTGNFAEFLEWTGRFIDPAKRIVNEVETAPAGDVSWRLHGADHESKIVLKHLEEQTGLTFTPGTRKVRVLFVEPGE